MKITNPFALRSTVNALQADLEDSDADCNFWVSKAFERRAYALAQDQAIDAHMTERAEILEENSFLNALIDYAAAEANEMDAVIEQQALELGEQDLEIEQLDAIIAQAALFVSRSRELLASIGVTIDTDEDGAPAMAINSDKLEDAVFPHFFDDYGAD